MIGVVSIADAQEQADEAGLDLVEVSPPYDTTGNTALLAANLLFEMLCVLPNCERRL